MYVQALKSFEIFHYCALTVVQLKINVENNIL